MATPFRANVVPGMPGKFWINLALSDLVDPRYEKSIECDSLTSLAKTGFNNISAKIWISRPLKSLVTSITLAVWPLLTAGYCIGIQQESIAALEKRKFINEVPL